MNYACMSQNKKRQLIKELLRKKQERQDKSTHPDLIGLTRNTTATTTTSTTAFGTRSQISHKLKVIQDLEYVKPRRAIRRRLKKKSVPATQSKETGESDQDQPDPPDPDEPEPVDMANAMTQNQLRLILREVLGDFGFPITDEGNVQQQQGPDGANVPVPPNPSLSERLITMRRKTETSKPPGPEVFRGTSSENPRLWKIKIRDYLNHCGYPQANEAERIRVIKMFLSDQALIWFEALQADQKATQEQFWTAFDANYFGQGNQYALEQTLLSRKQQAGEKVEAYISDVMSKANQLDWQAERTIAHLISGLNNKLKPLVLMKNPQNLAETCRAIEMAEEAVKTQGAELEDIQTTLKNISLQMKSDREEKKVAAAAPPVEQPATVNYMAPNYNSPPPSYNVPQSTYGTPPPRTYQPRSFGFRSNNRGTTRPVQPMNPIHIYTGNSGNSNPRPGRGRLPNRRPFRPDPGSGAACWQCGSPAHFKVDCPQNRSRNFGPRTQNQRSRGRPLRGSEN